MGRTAPEGAVLVDLPLETKETAYGEFRGRSQPLFPELGNANLKIFTGVEAELLESIIQEPSDLVPEEGGGGNPRAHINAAVGEGLPGTISIGNDGSCMIVEGV